MKINLLPLDQMKLTGDGLLKKIPQSEFDMHSFLQGRYLSFFANAKEAIHYIIQKHNLTREDEVYISTTSESNFVSTCVSATIFNYCKISRVITDRTKLIFIIHEFGFYNKQTKQLAKIAKERGVPIIEDSAHSLSTSFNGDRVGKYGNYTLFSLPKSIPVSNGGLMLSKEKINSGSNQQKIKESFEFYLPFINYFYSQRRELYRLLSTKLNCITVFGPVEENVPFSFIFQSLNFKEINEYLENENIQILRTYNALWVGLPINPLLTSKEINHLVSNLSKQNK